MIVDRIEYQACLGRFFDIAAGMEKGLEALLTRVCCEAVYRESTLKHPLSDEDRRRYFDDPGLQLQGQRDAALWLQRHAAIKSIIGSPRFATTSDSLKRVARIMVLGQKSIDEIGRVLSHLANINTFRNLLAHDGANPRGEPDWQGWMIVHSYDANNFSEVARSFRLSTLNAMSRDMSVGVELLEFAFNERSKSDYIKYAVTQPHIDRQSLLERIGPFHYEQEELIVHNPTIRAKSQAPKPRAKPSLKKPSKANKP